MRPQRILVVDDDPNMLLLMEFNLSRRGYDVQTATDGADALERSRNEPFDLLILDLMLPSLNGFEILESVRGDDRTADMPVLLVTARSRTEDFEEAARVGATDYITKPFDPIALVDQVDDLLRAANGTGP